MSRRKLNPNFGKKDNKKSLQSIYARARLSGALKLVGRELTEIPELVYRLLDKSTLSSDEKWWECIPLKSLDLSNNQIEEINSNIKEHEELEAIIIRSNKLQNIANELFYITTLQKFDVFDNELEVLPDDIQAPLVNINVGKNKLKTLPLGLARLDQLNKLSADWNKLEQLPQRLPNSLVSLTLSHNKLKSLPDCIGNLSRLENLDCSYNILKSCPDLSNCQQLQVFNIEANQLTELPKLPTSGKLSEINASSNGIRNIDGIELCRGANIILLHDNAISMLPNDIAKLPLRILDVSNNNLNDVPSELGRIASLNKLIMGGNYLRKLKRSCVDLKINDLKKYLRSRLGESDEMVSIGPVDINLAIRDAGASKELNLADAKLDEIPDDALTLTLRKVNLRGNQLVRLTSGIANWADSLQTLILDNNQLNELCNEIGQLVHLRELSVKDNNLKRLPNSLNNLNYLTTLDLRNNNFLEFPAAVLEVQSLVQLFLAQNNIRKLPRITNLNNLVELDMSSNSLEDIDASIHESKELKVLNLENNNLSSLPLEFGVMNLKALMVTGNRLRTIPYDKQRGSVDKLLTFLRNRIPDDSPLLQGNASNTSSSGPVDTGKLDELKSQMEELQEQLEDLSLTNAKKYALKKQLAKTKAALIREQRRMK